jgi:tetratricopeptide (TPR) repeat protein
MITGILVGSGCGPTFRELRITAQQKSIEQNWGAAKKLYLEASEMVPEHAENLHDLGVCSAILARRQFEDGNHAAGMRDADRAIDWYSRSITAHPGFRPSLIGKNRALELKGQFEEALRTAHWAATFVGPSAEQQLFLAQEYEERGDFDGALLRLRQGIAMEPRNAAAHEAIGDFFRRRGDDATAREAYLKSYRLDPSREGVASKLRSMGAEVPYAPTNPTG